MKMFLFIVGLFCFILGAMLACLFLYVTLGKQETILLCILSALLIMGGAISMTFAELIHKLDNKL